MTAWMMIVWSIFHLAPQLLLNKTVPAAVDITVQTNIHV